MYGYTVYGRDRPKRERGYPPRFLAFVFGAGLCGVGGVESIRRSTSSGFGGGDSRTLLAIAIFDALRGASTTEAPLLLPDEGLPFGGLGTVLIDGHFDLEKAAERLATLIVERPSLVL